ncbi:MAG: ThiF family adenylyltransferase [Xanthobacteraceae bacterium]|nr:ThiF family adenylyltransferase [Xanthobacteraceae bacterium]
MINADRAFLVALGGDGLLSWAAQVRAAEALGLTLGEIEEAALVEGLLPSRYARNRVTFSLADQLRFRRARVGVVGCGGIGGYIVEGLARVGVGAIVVVDPDSFEESNLNRQLLSTIATLGTAKVDAAVNRVAAINPAVTVVARRERLTCKNGVHLLEGCAVVVDALDSIAARKELRRVCDDLATPMVHGAIAGWYGQLCDAFPGDAALDCLYGQSEGLGEQARLGNPAFTPMAAAAFQVAEVCKIITGQGAPLRGRALMLDMCEGDVEIVGFADKAR